MSALPSAQLHCVLATATNYALLFAVAVNSPFVYIHIQASSLFVVGVPKCCVDPMLHLLVVVQVARLKPCNYPMLAVGPEDARGWCLVTGLRGFMLQDKAQVRACRMLCIFD